jgi:hypothetical protein
MVVGHACLNNVAPKKILKVRFVSPAAVHLSMQGGSLHRFVQSPALYIVNAGWVFPLRGVGEGGGWQERGSCLGAMYVVFQTGVLGPSGAIRNALSSDSPNSVSDREFLIMLL